MAYPAMAMHPRTLIYTQRARSPTHDMDTYLIDRTLL